MAKTTQEKGFSKQKQIQIAQNLYLSGGHTQKAIAEMVGISETTLINWIEKYDWETLKGANDTGRGRILANLLRRVADMTDQEKFGADEILKLTKAIEYFSPNKSSVSSEIEVIKKFMSYLYENDATTAKKIADLAESFINKRVKDAVGK